MTAIELPPFGRVWVHPQRSKIGAKRVLSLYYPYIPHTFIYRHILILQTESVGRGKSEGEIAVCGVWIEGVCKAHTLPSIQIQIAAFRQ